VRGATKLADFRERAFPDVGRLGVMVPLCTEHWFRFSAKLDDRVPEVRLERVARLTRLDMLEAS
jgi:hypothetical protein